MFTPSPSSPDLSVKTTNATPAPRKTLPWRVPNPKKDVAATPSCNPNYRPPAPGK